MSERTQIFTVATEQQIVRSDMPAEVFYYTPSIVVAENDALVVSHDVGGNVDQLPDFQLFRYSKQKMLCRIYTRQAGESRFMHRTTLPICHGRLFKVGSTLYIIGHNGSIQLAVSSDDGQTWSSPYQLTESVGWHASSCNVLQSNDRIYLCMERRSDPSILGWNVAGLSPHLLSAGIFDDLTSPESWKISNSFSFSQIFEHSKFTYFGIPFWETGYRWPALGYAGNRIVKSSPMGWLEGNVVQITDKTHVWYEPNFNTFCLFLRCNTAGVGYACVLKVVEDENLDLFTELVRAPSGEPLVFLPLPGGHNKFHMLYDEQTKTYWLCSTQPENSMKRMDCVDERVYGLPNNERHRLVLHYSHNCVDWLFCGVVAIGSKVQHARNYPSMFIHGENLLIVSRAGDEQALNSQYTNQILLHTVQSFRNLIY